MRIRSLAAGLAGLVLAVAAAHAQQPPPGQLPPLTVTPPPERKAAAPQPKQQPAAPLSAEPAAATQPSSPAAAAIQAIDPAASAVGKAQSASQGVVLQPELEAHPIYRTGELLEATPGLVVTQHSGEGKANQYFLRGFNLDHGTDLAITVDGMPVNMRTHGHGQGYADTSFLIPEIMRGLAYRKGPYFASEGDFSSAGAVHLDTVDRLKRSFAQVEIGSFGHRRAVTTMSAPVGLDGTVLAAGEAVHFDGPWERPDELRRLNGVMRYSRGSYDNGFALTAMAYSGHWYATDQVPRRAIEEGIIGRYGNIDPTDGGLSHRYSLSARWHGTTAEAATRVSAYAVKSDLQLFNNFTYFLNNPVDGDQFKQLDDRWLAGAKASHTLFFPGLRELRHEMTVGVETRYDSITVGLFNTKDRRTLSTVREDDVREASVGVFGEATLRWTPWLRTIAGLRADLYTAQVTGTLAENSGSARDTIVSPKAGLVLGPWARTELYLNAGTGFHSNDARGTVTTIDPKTLEPVATTPFLVRSKGAEVGLRTEPSRGNSAMLSYFILDFASENLFVGDAGTTEASRPSRRVGSELNLRARLVPWLTLDLDAAYTRARFLEDDPEAPAATSPVRSRASSAPPSISTTCGAACSAACTCATSARGP